MIDPPLWARPNASIDVQNGDFCEQENHKPKIRWSSISLEAPHQQDTPEGNLLKTAKPAKAKIASVPNKAKTNAAKLTPAEARIRDAIAANFPDGFPEGLTVKGRNKKIIEWVSKNAPGPVSAKSINRYVSKFMS
jgi:hypothetical protein